VAEPNLMLADERLLSAALDTWPRTEHVTAFPYAALPEPLDKHATQENYTDYCGVFGLPN